MSYRILLIEPDHMHREIEGRWGEARDAPERLYVDTPMQLRGAAFAGARRVYKLIGARWLTPGAAQSYDLSPAVAGDDYAVYAYEYTAFNEPMSGFGRV